MDKPSRMELRRKHGFRDLPKPTIKYVGPEYSMSFVCLDCKTSNMRHFDCPPFDYPGKGECPVCKGVTFNLGRNFKPPKKNDSAQWNKIAYLIEHGFMFQKIRPVTESFESVPYPETLTEAKEFVVKYKKWAHKNAF
jgi:hypothetical protein